MKNYISQKQVKAKPMTRQEYNDYRGWEVPADENPADEGYLVEYIDSPNSNHPNHDGYISWSPKDVFDRSHRVLPDGEADFLPYRVFPSDIPTVISYPDEEYGGAHQYLMRDCIGFHEGETKYVASSQFVQFVKKLSDGTIVPGLQSEQLLIALIDRHKKLNAKFPSHEGETAIAKMEQALHWLEARVKERMTRGVMGNLKK